MRTHVAPRVHEFADLIAVSGDGWQHDRKVFEFIQRGPSGRWKMADYKVRQAIADIDSMIETYGPDWLNDWYAAGEIKQALYGEVKRHPIKTAPALRGPRPTRTSKLTRHLPRPGKRTP